ncbi:MAG TPA: peptidoglycan DD-metalloendopeptidase family protein [Flavisolibacter sp.]|jgi:murein DD-endopeptidase MepM/ murein hydrolase activator NlpD|nr:peptidoglycan DD-metalloendopeptidase family protein [Flavisolibacter sp.]
MQTKSVEEVLKAYTGKFHPVVPWEKTDRLLLMDFTAENTALTDAILLDTQSFTDYVNSQLFAAGAKYGVGGYNEHRTVYSRSKVFDAENGAEARRLHLGIDIWGKPYTKVMAPLDGIVHSFAFNNAFGDYGAMIILTHQLGGLSFHTLYGHLSLNSLKNLQEGDLIRKGDVFCEFGIPFENGQWPPHLHFQIINSMEGWKGDYPGVCAFSERDLYLANCPDADLILEMMSYTFKP